MRIMRIMRIMRLLAAALLPAALFAGFVAGCGMSVHNEVTLRALYAFHPTNTSYARYAEYMERYPTYVQAGSFFPDWGYGCAGHDRESEAAHWPSFLKVATEYVREKYPQPWDRHPSAQKFVAFLFAVASHDAADVSWHNLRGMSHGFIQEMADLNFYGSYGEAHSAADNGGEFTLSHMTDLDYLSDIWDVPLSGLQEIYRRMGLQANPEEMRICITRALAAQQANKRFGKVFFPYYGEKSPFLIEQMEHYYRGGLYNMAATTHDCWYGLARWFEDGPGDDRKLCDIFRRRHKHDAPPPVPDPPVSGDSDSLPRLDAMAMLDAAGYRITEHTDEHGVTRFELRNQFAEGGSSHSSEQQAHFEEPWERDESDDSLNNLHLEKISQIPLDTSRAGGHHEFPLKLTRQCNVSSERSASLILEMPVPYSSFGREACVGDFNGDGFDDLAIGAPYYSPLAETPHVGAVFIINGNREMSATTGTEIILDFADQVLYAPEAKAESRFGWSCTAVDLNGDGIDDLAIGAPSSGTEGYPYSGKVHVFFGRYARGLPSAPDLQIDASGAEFERMNITGLGHTLSSGDIDRDGRSDLLLGCPMCSRDGGNQTGAVFAFLGASAHRGRRSVLDSDLWLFAPSAQEYEWFGAAVEVSESPRTNSSTLLVGAPGHVHNGRQWVGRLYGYDVTQRKQPALKFDLSGTEEFQGFGSSIISGDLANDGRTLLAVSSPSEAFPLEFPHFGKLWQAGAVRIFDESVLRNGTVLSDLSEILVMLRGSESSSHLGFAMHRNGDSLWISEPFASGESGVVFHYSLRQILSVSSSSPPSKQLLAHDAANECIKSGENQSRLGGRIVSFDLNGDGRKDLVVTAEHSSQVSRFSGRVEIIFG